MFLYNQPNLISGRVSTMCACVFLHISNRKWKSSIDTLSFKNDTCLIAQS